MGVKDKVAVAKKLCEELEITLDEVAYIGDDINDVLLLEKVGISAAPANAPTYIKNKVDFVTETKGGEGAFREFVECILEKYEALEKVLDKYLENQIGLNQ